MTEIPSSANSAQKERSFELLLKKFLGGGRSQDTAGDSQPRRKRFKLVALVPLLMFITLAGWAFSSPVSNAPDADYHLPSIWCGLGDREGLCASTEDPGIKLANQAIVVNPETTPHTKAKDLWIQCFLKASANCQQEWIAEHSDDLSYTKRVNAGPGKQYADYYYAIMSTMASQDIYTSIWSIRLVNAGLFVLIGTLLYLALPKTRRQAFLLVWSIGLIPMGLFYIPSTHPSSWGIGSVAFVFMAMVGFMETTGRRRIALGCIATVALFMAAASRQDTGVYAVLGIGLALLLQARRGDKDFWRWFTWPAALVLLAAVMYLSYPRNLARDGLPILIEYPSPGFSGVQVFVRNIIEIPGLIFEAMAGGGLGVNGAPTHFYVRGMVVAAIFIIVGFGMSFGGRRKGIAAVIAVASLWVFPMYIYIVNNMYVGQGIVQPRYLPPLTLLFFAVILYSQRGRGLILKTAICGRSFRLSPSAELLSSI